MKKLIALSVLLLCCCMISFAQESNNGKQLWAKSILNEKAPELKVEKWLSEQPETKGKFVLIDFWATWCGPCMRQGPIVEALAEEGYNVGKIDVDQEMGLAQQFKVMSIPTLLIFKGGQEVHRLVGLTSKEDLKKLLDE